jgi:hypothetical protein
MCDGAGNICASLEALEGAIREFVVTTSRAAAHGDHLIGLRHGMDLLELAFSRAAASFATTSEYEASGSTSPINWIRHECKMSGGAAARSITTGEQAERLPASLAALDQGRIGFTHLTMLAGTARSIRETAGEAAFHEQPLLDLALDHPVRRFESDCSHARHRADAAAVLAEQVDAVRYRYLEVIPCDGGAVAVRGLLDPVGAAVVRAALEPLTKPIGADDERSRRRRLADALVELAQHSLDHGFITDTGGQRTHLQLTASVETVMGLDGAPGGDLEFAGAVPAATVQRLACDASIRRVLLGPDSAVIDVGRALRVPAGATRAALRVRDGGCVWPGCDRPSSWTNAHHMLHWSHGGDTNLENLVLLCHHHHWSVHEGGWQLVRPDGHVLAIPPSHTYRSWTRAPDGVTMA